MAGTVHPCMTIVTGEVDQMTIWMVHPVQVAGAWPSGSGSSVGVLLGAEADAVGVASPDAWPTGRDQGWPQGAIKYLARLGREVALRRDGLPLVDRDILTPPTESLFWKSLTIGFGHRAVNDASFEAWSNLRQRTHGARRAAPAGGEALPPGLDGLLWIGEADYGCFASSERQVGVAWLASQIAHVSRVTFGIAIDPDIADRVAAWITDNDAGTGARLFRFRQVKSASGHVLLRIEGQWGRGVGTLIGGGTPDGERFSSDFG